jgi:YD repeat-containing protein
MRLRRGDLPLRGLFVGETWVPLGESWLGHRPEPLIHERVWACPLTGRGPYRGAFDSQGRGIAYRQSDGYEERTTYDSDRIVVRIDAYVKLETKLDGDGRPVETRYASGEVERYRYDDDRLVEIDEAAGLLKTVISGERWETGGRLRVEHDEDGPCAIRAEDELVWERRDEPWPALLARGAAEIADGIADAIERAVEDPELPVARLGLTYVEASGLYTVVSLGLDDVRADEEHFWYPIGEGGGLEEIDGMVEDELDRLLLREAALNDPDQPQRTVLNAVAAALARRDWTGVIAPTEDFVAFIAEHDEDIAPKRESLRAVNPPERAATWEARFPPSEYE